eukprot:TRINITY_DN11166_c0_g1_i1.p1 TRINITY_DN11166_c0_g1~~TRINITY_DN11166_c0_g1_i1.p1  ORF type:complete len:123 (+),score=0.67 TRINITY_DN11166_c0_g1_i1:64-432(+)
MSHPDLRKKFHPGNPASPTTEELRRRKASNFDTRFNSPYGFKEQRFKRGFSARYPGLTFFGLTGLFLGVIFWPFSNNYRSSTRDGKFLAEVRRQREADSGFWDKPLTFQKKKENESTGSTDE